MQAAQSWRNLTNREHYTVDMAVTQWIEHDYNVAYLHSSLGYRTPTQYETEWFQRQSMPIASIEAVVVNE